MSKYDVTVTIEADTIQDALMSILYPEGIPLDGVSKVWAEKENAA